MKPTLVLGASQKPHRVSNQAVIRLRSHGHTVVALGRRPGQIGDVPIQTQIEDLEPGSVHTVSMYLNAQNQREFYDLVLNLKPERIYFNPGAENPELCDLATQAGIQCLNQCMMVAMSLQYF